MSSPTSRTLEHCRKLGMPVGVVERWIERARKRIDFLGFIDLIALDGNPGALGIQACSDGDVSKRVAKIRVECHAAATAWVRAGNRIHVIGWGKRGPRGQAKRWRARIVEITAELLAGELDSERTARRIEGRWDVAMRSGCWLWKGAMSDDGYGIAYNEAGTKLVHRIVHEAMYGPIPRELCIDHLCRNRRCVNPDHMETVTLRENILRGEGRGAKLARQTHCVHGHPFDGANTYVAPSGRRACKVCRRGIDKKRARATKQVGLWGHDPA